MGDEEIRGDIITPERLAKGDLDHTIDARDRIASAQARPTVLSHLIERRILDPHHGEYANRFEDMRRASRRKTDYGKLSSYALEFFGNTTNGSDLETLYIRVTRSLTRAQEEDIIYANTTPYSPGDTHMLIVGTLGFRSAFDRLVIAIDQERKRLREDAKHGKA